MKLLHLSDLHIGKRVYEYSMLEDQKYILNQVVAIVKEEKPDAVLLAGDLYDKPIPPAEAVCVLDEFLSALSELDTTVLAISGNHDSPERLSFGASLMKQSKVYVSAVYRGELPIVTLEDQWGEIDFYLMPFLKPSVVKHWMEEEEIESYTDAVRAVLRRAAARQQERFEAWNAGSKAQGTAEVPRRRVLLAHQFVTGAARSESEEISVGGTDNVDASIFDGFDYVALGHLHGPQNVGSQRLRYCGTPLKYSFSETGQKKSVTVVEIGAPAALPGSAACSIRTVLLKPLRDMREIRGSYLEVTARDFYSRMNREDYVRVILTDEEDIPGGMDKLRTIYHNLMRLEYDNRRTRENQSLSGAEETERKTPLAYFSEFYQKQNNGPLEGGKRETVQRLIEEVWEENR